MPNDPIPSVLERRYPSIRTGGLLAGLAVVVAELEDAMAGAMGGGADGSHNRVRGSRATPRFGGADRPRKRTTGSELGREQVACRCAGVMDECNSTCVQARRAQLAKRAACLFLTDRFAID